MGEGPGTDRRPQALRAYLLGTLSFDDAAALQRRLMYEVAGEADAAAVLVLDHPTGITIGREGSRQHLRPDDNALAQREWPVQWVSRGSGVMLHLPGQVACYPVLPLDRLGLTVGEYLRTLHQVVLDVLTESKVTGELDPVKPGVFVAGRRIAHIGVSVRDDVTGHGVVLNVNPDLEPFHDIHCDGDLLPMTSVQRETIHRVRLATFRQRFVDAVQRRFGFARVSLFHPPPVSVPAPGFHAVPYRTH